MSLILPPTAASTPPAKPGSRAAAPADGQDQHNAGSFGEALARSLESEGEKIAKPAAKAANLTPARRQADPEKAAAEELANAMALSLTPLQARVASTVLPGGGNVAAGASPAGAAGVLPLNPGSAVSGAAAVFPDDVLAQTPLAAGEPADAASASALASIVAAASPKSNGQTPLPASNGAAGNGAALQIDSPAIAAQAKAASPDLSGQPSRQDEKDVNILRESSDERAGLALVLPQGSRKAATSAAAASKPESAASPVTSSPVAADAVDAAVSVSAALPANPATAAAQTLPGGVAASSAPAPTASATLMPEVGNNEWGKALGQQVVQMGHAGQQVAELQLNPPGLGPLKVTLSMNDHQMQAMFVSAHSSVRAAVEAALPQLRATLAENGISLGQTSVGAENQQQTAFSNARDDQPERGTYYRPAAMAQTANLLPAGTVAQSVRNHDAMRIDTYA